MKLILLKNNLIEAITSVERSLGQNTNLPILKNILISTTEDRIVFTTTNLEMAVSHISQGKIIEKGKITAPFGIFSAIIKNLNSERVILETTSDGGLLVVTDNYEATIQGSDATEFPIIPDITDKKNSLKIEAIDFLDCMKSVIVATQFSDVRPEISGVYISYSEEGMVFVATDSFRLAEKTLRSTSVLSDFENVSFIIPIRAAEEVLRVINDSDGQISVFIEQNQVFFFTKTKKITSRLVDGVFPDYKPIIPKETETEIYINREEIINAIKLTSAFSGRTNDVVFTVNENKKVMEISSSEGSLGKNKYKIPIKLKGDPIGMVFNWKYVLDGLKTHSTESIVFGLNSPEKPAVIKDPLNRFFTYVVMPIRK